MAGFKEYGEYDATGLAELVEKGEVQALELLDEAVSRLDKMNPELNAVVDRWEGDARAELERNGPVKGAFTGVPFLMKDLVAMIEGRRMTSACRFTRDYRAEVSTELYQRYVRAGLVSFGKTNTPELGLAPVTESRLFGPCRNPWDADKTSGGSSGGAAVAVATGVVPMAHGNDGGGSIRMPASCCGLFGLKPSRGRTPTGPLAGHLFSGMAVEHVLSRSVRDSARALDATHGIDPGAPFDAPAPERSFASAAERDPGRLRIGYSLEPMLGYHIHPDCVVAVEATAKLLEGLGHHVEEAKPLPLDFDSARHAYMTLVAGDTSMLIRHFEKIMNRGAIWQEFEPQTWSSKMVGERLSATDFSLSLAELDSVHRQLAQFLDAQQYDVLLSPTLAAPPLKIGEHANPGRDAMVMQILRFLPFLPKPLLHAAMRHSAPDVFTWMAITPLFNATGQPAMSVPIHWNDDGLPLGSHFVARYGQEELLFSLAGQIERAAPWAHRRPRHHVENVVTASGAA